MPKCKVCGTRLAEGVAKCPSCGAAAGSTVSGTVSPGTTLQKSVCPACNKQILGEHKYCPNCGTNLNSASACATNKIQQMTHTRTQANGQELVSDNSHKNKNETEKQQLQSNAQTKQQKSVQKQLSGKYIALKVMQLIGYLALIIIASALVAENASDGQGVILVIMLLLIFIVVFVIFKSLADLSSGKKSPSFAREFLLSVGAIIGFIMFCLGWSIL